MKVFLHFNSFSGIIHPSGKMANLACGFDATRKPAQPHGEIDALGSKESSDSNEERGDIAEAEQGKRIGKG
jgi:hypothetical protein